MTPEEYCEDKAAKSGSSFYYSFRFLPQPKRLATTALYAFCREVDDVVDECSDIALAQTKLNWWRNEITQMFAGTPQHPVTRALTPATAQFNLPLEHFLEIIDGMEMDLHQFRYPDFNSLQLYCYRVASVVGLMAAEIFGLKDQNTLKYAHDLGMAFQLTNIIRDVGEDARRNRIYLPSDEMQRFNVPAAEILNYRESENFRALMTFQADPAEQFYASAMQNLAQVDRKNQRPGLIMAAIYHTLLQEIKRDGFQVLNQRSSLTPLRKLWLAWVTWFKN